MAFRRRHLLGIASALVPGLGQALAGQLREALMLVLAAIWIGAFLAAQSGTAEAPAQLSDQLLAFVVGAPAIDGGLRKPVLVLFTGLLFALHALAAWAAARAPTSDPGPLKGSGEAV